MCGKRLIGCVAVPEDIEQARALGYDYVELSGRALCALTGPEFRELRSRVADGLPCLGLNAYCPPEVRISGPGFSKGAAREYALRSAQRAEGLGVRVVGVGSPFSRDLPDGYDRARAWDEALTFFSVTAEVFAPQGVTICVEALAPCYCNFINHLEEACRLSREVGAPNLRAVLDFYNMEHVGEADMPLGAYIADIAHAHISDDDAGDPRRRWFLRPDKQGIHRRRVDALYALGYRGLLTVETDLRLDPAAAALTLDTLRKREKEEE